MGYLPPNPSTFLLFLFHSRISLSLFLPVQFAMRSPYAGAYLSTTNITLEVILNLPGACNPVVLGSTDIRRPAFFQLFQPRTRPSRRPSGHGRTGAPLSLVISYNTVHSARIVYLCMTHPISAPALNTCVTVPQLNWLLVAQITTLTSLMPRRRTVKRSSHR